MVVGRLRILKVFWGDWKAYFQGRELLGFFGGNTNPILQVIQNLVIYMVIYGWFNEKMSSITQWHQHQPYIDWFGLSYHQSSSIARRIAPNHRGAVLRRFEIWHKWLPKRKPGQKSVWILGDFLTSHTGMSCRYFVNGLHMITAPKNNSRL